MRLYIVGMKQVKKDTETMNIYKVLLEYNGKEDFEYKIITAPESVLVNDLNTQKFTLVNAEVKSGKIVGKTGSMDRFLGSSTGPIVILAEIRNKDSVLLGYRVANRSGEVRRISLTDTLRFCAESKKNGHVAIQNAIYVETTAERHGFIRAYPNGEYVIEYIKSSNKNKYSKTANTENKEEARAIKKDKLEDLFTKEQIVELRKAKDAGVDPRLIGNNKLSAEQMRIVWEAEKNGFRGRIFADPAYTIENMKFYSAELECKSDITQLLNPNYSLEQIFEISLGLDMGLDVSKYANPKNSAVKMSEMRSDLEHKVWKNYTVHFGSLSELV